MFSLILQIILPHHLLSRLIMRFLRIRWRWLKSLQIRFVICRFNVDMSPVENPDIDSFEHFNAFFTRAMKAEARPISKADSNNDYCSPVDGTVSEFGVIRNDRLTQAKGIDYSLLELVGNQPDIATRFINGHFLTIYLSPRDYHRIHMPASGVLRCMVYVPGRLFSVADKLVQNLPNLFNRNERVICLFETSNGPMAIIMVGAIFVGCMDTVWAGTVSPPHRSKVERTNYNNENSPQLNKGDEMGRFNMGSTVIVLWPGQHMDWSLHFTVGSTSIKMGQHIGSRVNH